MKYTMFVLFLLVGCDARQHWSNAPSTHTCTVEQMTKAQSEALWCKSNTGYTGEYCYSTAIFRNCTMAKGTP